MDGPSAPATRTANPSITEFAVTFFNRSIELDQAVATEDAVSHHDKMRMVAASATRAGEFAELALSVTEEDRALWCMMKPCGRPSFTPALLGELLRAQELVRSLAADAAGRRFDYAVFGSDVPGVFNLGGDLTLFADKVAAGDREALRRYGYTCCDVVHANYAGYGDGVVTIGLVEGDALGGGWESAASFDVLVAERGARFGFPEILFNLFPGMGAYSFLSRRVGPIKAEALILSGDTYTAEQLHAIGLVDVLAETGQGRQAVKACIAARRGKRNAHAALYQVRRRVNPVTLQELRDVVDVWTEAAMRLGEPDLRKMRRIAAAQDRMRARAPSTAAMATA